MSFVKYNNIENYLDRGRYLKVYNIKKKSQGCDFQNS